MSAAEPYTPTQRRLLAVLADGLPHSRQELFSCLVDDYGSLSNLKPHLTKLRRVLRPLGQEIVCELVNRGAVRYRHVRLLTAAPQQVR